MNKYLEHMDKFLHEDNEDEDKYEDLIFVEDDWDELQEELTGKGLEIIEIWDPGDGVLCLFEDGELKLTAYTSTRGSMYQTGAYDGQKSYFKTNLSHMHDGTEWFPMDQSWKEVSDRNTCASIAKDGWKWVTDKEYREKLAKEAEEEDSEEIDTQAVVEKLCEQLPNIKELLENKPPDFRDY